MRQEALTAPGTTHKTYSSYIAFQGAYKATTLRKLWEQDTQAWQTTIQYQAQPQSNTTNKHTQKTGDTEPSGQTHSYTANTTQNATNRQY